MPGDEADRGHATIAFHLVVPTLRDSNGQQAFNADIWDPAMITRRHILLGMIITKACRI